MIRHEARPTRRLSAASMGQALPEYGLILALGICVCIAALSFMGSSISEKVDCLAKGILPGQKNNVDC